MATIVDKTTVLIGNVRADSNAARGVIGITIFPPTGTSFRLSAVGHWYDPQGITVKENSVTAIIPAGGSFDTHEETSHGTCTYTWFTHEI